MPPWKKFLLSLYYYGSIPYRTVWRRRAAAQGRLPVVVLFYHRVADVHPTEWTVDNHTFRRQIDWLQKHFELISLEEAQRRVRSGKNTRPAVALTFDDGYAENCEHAIPLLIERNIPCAYFATLSNIQTGRPFDHDLALGLDLPPNTPEQLREMAAAGIEIGAHCRRHVDLASLRNPQELRDEVVVAGEELARLVERPVRYIVFPFGHYLNIRSDALQMAREAGYLGYGSAYGGYNLPAEDPFHLQRIHVNNDLIRLKNRTTIDPRRLEPPRFRTRPFPYTNHSDSLPCFSDAAN